LNKDTIGRISFYLNVLKEMSKMLSIVAVALCCTVGIGVTGFSLDAFTADNHIIHSASQKISYLTISSQRKKCKERSMVLHLFPEEQSAAMILAETESWRQYVPLAVSVGVIADILLGSPLANLALAPMKRATEDDKEEVGSEGGGEGTANKRRRIRNPNERVDADAIGKAAVERARYSMELRTFLEENKSDEDKYEDMRKKIDAMAQDFDSRKPL